MAFTDRRRDRRGSPGLRRWAASRDAHRGPPRRGKRRNSGDSGVRYSSSPTLWRMSPPLDSSCWAAFRPSEKSVGRTRGRVRERRSSSSMGSPTFAASRNGTAVYASGSVSREVVLVDRGGADSVLLRGPGLWAPRFSPDGERLAYGAYPQGEPVTDLSDPRPRRWCQLEALDVRSGG